jgi:predicted metal-dependent hydrolase
LEWGSGVMESKKPDSLSYSLIKSSRKTIGIIVHTDGSVVVRAPHRTTKKEIDEVINKRFDWILKHKKRFEEQGPAYSKSEFVDGEKHLFLGKEYIMRVTIGTFNNVTINGEFIDVECKNESLVKPLMEQWYRQKANKLMPQIITPIIDKFNSLYDISPNKISLKNMKSRWGSCSSKANISMNIKLIKSTESCIEYVMAHELCHLLQMNHSKNFYSLLTEFMPDWRERKKSLDYFMR